MFISRKMYNELVQRVEDLETQVVKDMAEEVSFCFLDGTTRTEVPTLKGTVSAILNKLGYQAEIQTADKMVVLKRPQKAKK